MKCTSLREGTAVHFFQELSEPWELVHLKPSSLGLQVKTGSNSRLHSPSEVRRLNQIRKSR